MATPPAVAGGLAGASAAGMSSVEIPAAVSYMIEADTCSLLEMYHAPDLTIFPVKTISAVKSREERFYAMQRRWWLVEQELPE